MSSLWGSRGEGITMRHQLDVEFLFLGWLVSQVLGLLLGQW